MEQVYALWDELSMFPPADADQALAHLTRGLGGLGTKALHRQFFLNAGLLIGDTPLSPMARRVISKLLTGMTEKEIAAALNQPFTTTHKYVTSIYERFGVKSRAGLMALWLGR